VEDDVLREGWHTLTTSMGWNNTHEKVQETLLTSKSIWWWGVVSQQIYNSKQGPRFCRLTSAYSQATHVDYLIYRADNCTYLGRSHVSDCYQVVVSYVLENNERPLSLGPLHRCL
jgi:hypothetical protein